MTNRPKLEYGRASPPRRMSAWALLGYGVVIPLLLAEVAGLVLYGNEVGRVLLVIAGGVAVVTFAVFLLRS